MSYSLHQTVRSKHVGSPTAKLILLEMAWRAADDGSRAYASTMAELAEVVGCSTRTVQACLSAFRRAGLIFVTGGTRCPGGEIPIYALNVAAIQALKTLGAFLRRWRADKAEAEASELGTSQAPEADGSARGADFAPPGVLNLPTLKTQNLETLDDAREAAPGDGDKSPPVVSSEALEARREACRAVRVAAGQAPTAPLSGGWCDRLVRPHLAHWGAVLGLSLGTIIETIETTRRRVPATVISSPAYFDGPMREAQERKAQERKARPLNRAERQVAARM